MNMKAQGPKVTNDDIEAAIASEHYFTGNQGAYAAELSDGVERNTPLPEALFLLTICVIVLKNGFSVTGESACVSFENFDKEVGRKWAREAAIKKLWPLMGYGLKDKLYREGQS